VDNQGAAKGKNKAQGGQRIMYTAHHSCWDAKNRFSLPEEMAFDFAGIAHLFPVAGNPATPAPQTPAPPSPTPAAPPPVQDPPKSPPEPQKPAIPDGIPQPLADLMAANSVTGDEIQQAVALKGYYPQNTPISNYDPNFINGVLVGAWSQVFQMIVNMRGDKPPFDI
jgi:hypothetical protein